MQADEVQRHLEETGALKTGHFALSSGLHSDRYVQCALVLARPSRASLLGAGLGAQWVDDDVELVVGPALGGVVIAHEVARFLGTPCFFAERKEGTMCLRRGFQVEPGTKVLVVEDVVTTGGSVKEVLALLEQAGAHIVGVSSIVWRAGADEEAPVSPFGDRPFKHLLRLPVPAWKPEQCPPCQAGHPVDKPGSRPTLSSSAGGDAS